MAEHGFTMRSQLPGVSQEQVWERIASWDGVDHELGPWFRMTRPRGSTRVAELPADGESHFTSVLLLLGVLPFERHRLALRAIRPPEHFDERSSNLMMEVWIHERSVRPVAGGVEVADRCRIVPRIALLGPLLAWSYARVFRWRHRRLRTWFAARARPRGA